MKILCAMGTRPEVIKFAPLIKELINDHQVITVITGQHPDLAELTLIPSKLNYVLNNHHKDLVDLVGWYSTLLIDITKILIMEKPDLVLVQGDTASAYTAALASFLQKIPIGHIEAGLRTYDLASPLPEEANRQLISRIASIHFCPTRIAVDNLKNENIKENVYLTGNTIVDAVKSIFTLSSPKNPAPMIIVTLHRRENADLMRQMLDQIIDLAKKHPKYTFVIPTHPNRLLRDSLPIVAPTNLKVVDPIPYKQFVTLLSHCTGIITDSGGIQEEAICLGKKVILCRDNTERPEGIEYGLVRVVGTNIRDNFEWLIRKEKVMKKKNPYGKDASKQIARIINKDWLATLKLDLPKLNKIQRLQKLAN